MRNFNIILSAFLVSALLVFNSCDKDESKDIPKDPNNATIANVDRFSDEAAVLMKRSENSLLPAANTAIDFDMGDFITQSYGPEGEIVKYYNFDVQPLAPAPIYILFREGEIEPVEDQLNIINVIPGDLGYSDFWIIYKVMVPSDYEANLVSSYSDIAKKGYSIDYTNTIVNCPVVPQGSTASMRLGSESSSLDRGWYKDQIVYYFNFLEKDLETTSSSLVPVSPIYVTFNINPDATNSDSGPASGFVTETGSLQTHNVIATIPSDTDYSPLWSVYIYDNTNFENVSNLETAEAATILAEAAMYVNCPVVYMED